jgi:hypothetical protein
MDLSRIIPCSISNLIQAVYCKSDLIHKELPLRNLYLKKPFSRSYLQEKLVSGEEALELPLFQLDSRIAYEILNYIEGKNLLLEIRILVVLSSNPSMWNG